MARKRNCSIMKLIHPLVWIWIMVISLMTTTHFNQTIKNKLSNRFKLNIYLHNNYLKETREMSL